MDDIHIGTKIKAVLKQSGIPITEFADKIGCVRENVYDIFKRETVDTHLLKMVSDVLEYDFFAELSKSYYSSKATSEDESRRRAIGQFWDVVPRLMRKMDFNGYINPCSADDVEPDVHFPIPDYIIGPDYFLITIGETFEERYRRYEIDGFEFKTIKDKSGASVMLCDNIVCGRQCINIVLDYKTEEEWRNTLELAFVTADKHYNDATKFSIKSAIGY